MNMSKNSPHELVEALTFRGLDKIQATIYLATMRLREPTVAAIAREANLKRTTVYSYIDELLDAGYLSSTRIGRRTMYLAAKPQLIVERARKELSKIKAALPELNDHFRTYRNRPKVTLFSGEQGLQEVYADVLASGKAVAALSNVDDFLRQYAELHREFVKCRIQAGIPVRVLMPKTRKAITRQALSVPELRDVRFVPARLLKRINAITWIYGSKVAYFTFRSEPTAVIIENQDIAESTLALFDLLWDLAESK